MNGSQNTKPADPDCAASQLYLYAESNALGCMLACSRQVGTIQILMQNTSDTQFLPGPQV